MARAIVYCDRCGLMIPPSEVDRGNAMIGESVAVCPECTRKLAPDERDALRRRLSGESPVPPDPAPQRPEPGERRRSGRTRAVRRAAGGSGRLARPQGPRAPGVAGRPGDAGPRRAAAAPGGPAPDGASATRRTSVRAVGPASVGPASVGPASVGRAAPPLGQARASGGIEIEDAVEEVPEAPRSRKGLFIASLVAGVLAGVAIAVLMASKPSRRPDSDGPDTKDKPVVEDPTGKPPGPAPKTDTPPATATALQRRFAEIKHVFDPSFMNYDEGRRLLKKFVAEYPEGPEAEKARALLQKMGVHEVKTTEEAFAATAKRAEHLASRGKFDEAMKILQGESARLAESEWFKTGGEKKIAAARAKVEAARAKVEAGRIAAAKATVERAREALRSKRPDEARKLLSPRGKWPREAREAAEAVLKEIAAAEAEADKLRGREQKWDRFVIALHVAGRKGARGASDLAARERSTLRELGFGRKLARMEGLVREAKLVEELAALGLGAWRKTLRLQLKDRRVGGKVLGIQDGVLKLKPMHGAAIDVPLDQIGTEDILRFSGVGRSEGGDPLKAAAYLAVRGDLKAARERLANLPGEKAVARGKDIDELARVIVPPKITSAAPAEAREGSYYSHTFAASGVAPIAFSLDDPAKLPAGLTWNAATATISGTPGAVGTSAEITLAAANGIAPDAGLAFTITVSDRGIMPEGRILREWWTGIPGRDVSDLTSHADYPDNPAGHDFLTKFHKGSWGNTYGQRIRGYLHPPVSGDYTFRTQSDDRSELWLSTDEDPANKVQKRNNATVTLVAGQRYYIEAIHKEEAGGDHITIGWKRPDAVQDKAIPGKYLSPWKEGDAPPPAAMASASSIPGLVAHWSFDDKADPGADSSGKDRHGDVRGAAWTEKGRLGGALEFDGRGSFIDLPDGFADFTGGFTFAVWAYPTAAAHYARFIDIGNGRAKINILFCRIGTTADVILETHSETGIREFLTASDVLESNTWQHLVATLDASGQATVYRDGLEIASGRVRLPPNATRASNYIGRSNWGGNRLYQGLMDDFRIYDRAISAAEVKVLFGGSVAGAPAAPVKGTAPVGPVAAGGLVAHWKFDEESGTTARDSSGKGHDGTIVGAKWAKGKLGGALEFDGKSYVDIGSGVTELGKDDFTIAAWVITDVIGGAILSKSNNNNRYEGRERKLYLCRHGDPKQKPVGSVVWVGHGTEWISGSKQVNDDKWHHVAVTWDSVARKGMMYVDGAAGVTISNFNGREDNPNDKIRIGWTTGGEGTVNFNGLIDDVRIYERALSADQVRAVFEGTATAAAKVAVKLPAGEKKPLPGETGRPGEWAPGLISEIFRGRGYRERVGVRIDRSILGDFFGGFPDLGPEPGRFSIRWKGYFLAPVAGGYSFNRPEGFARFEIDGKKVIGVPGGVKLTKGLHRLEATARGVADRAKTWIQYGGPAGAKNLESLLYHKVPELGSMGPFAKLVRGLKAEYFKDDSCRRLAGTGTIDRLEFDLGDLAACTGCSRDRFSMRITGYVLVPEEGEYIFKIEKHGGDGVQLYLEGKSVIDMWARGADEDTGKTKLAAGYRKIRVHLRNMNGASRLKVLWDGPRGGMHPIPAHAVFMEPPPKPRVVKRSGSAPGVKGYVHRGTKPGRRPVAERIDASLTVDWSGTPPAPGVPRDSYCVVWSGFFVAPESGQYMFRLEHDGGGVQLSVGGRRVINRPGSTKGNAFSNLVALPQGPAAFSLLFARKKSNKVFVKLWWTGPNFHIRPVGGGDLAHAGSFDSLLQKPAPPTVKPPPKPPAGRPVKPEPEEPVEPLPKGNLVRNGGFEETGSAVEVAEAWTKHQWGTGKGSFSVRLDRVNSHAGERSLVVRALGADGHPGARTTLTSSLPPATYEVRFWACAAIGKSADVCAHLAGRDVLSASVGEEWKQFKTTVEITKKKLKPSLRLYTTTQGVRVWFDDAEVEALPRPTR